MDSASSEKKSFLWDIDAGEEGGVESPIDLFPSRVPKAVETPRNARNDENEVGTLGTLGTRPETLGLGCSDLVETPRNARNTSLPDLPGVPVEWIAGVYRLRTMQAPCEMDERRWDRFRYDALRILHEHGAVLHAAGWDEIDVFGLHRIAPDRRTDGMGLAWLARKMVVVTVEANAVTLRGEGDVLQRVFKKPGDARLVSVAGWSI